MKIERTVQGFQQYLDSVKNVISSEELSEHLSNSLISDTISKLEGSRVVYIGGIPSKEIMNYLRNRIAEIPLRINEDQV